MDRDSSMERIIQLQAMFCITSFEKVLGLLLDTRIDVDL
jgi:hypothetical protein